MNNSYDIIIIGGGSGGIGAALGAARQGLNVLLVEKADQLGGTAAIGGVNNWEPVVGGTGFPFEIYKCLTKIPDAVGISTFGRHISCQKQNEQVPYPGGEGVIDLALSYIDTLRRHGAGNSPKSLEFRIKNWHSVVFEPDAYSQVVEQMLDKTGHCTVLKKTAFSRAIVDRGHLVEVELDNGQKISAPFFVDATADIVLAMACGCKFMVGQESKDVFNEPSAPSKPTGYLNSATLVFRVSRKNKIGVDPLPEDIPKACWWRECFPYISVEHYSCGDLNINMLPTMAGDEAFKMGSEAAYKECYRRILAQWHYNQINYTEFQQYSITWVAPMLGMRETRRIKSSYILTEHDLLNGLSCQDHPDIIAVADHAMDIHAAEAGHGRCIELNEPYGIPYRCLLSKDIDNLMIACRGAGFSSVAASSCRLSRTIMQLGQAAGMAAVLAKQENVPLLKVPLEKLRASLRRQHVQLEWPLSEEIKTYINSSDPMCI